MNNVLKWLVRIFAICVLVQVFLAGAALFDDPGYWTAHTTFPRFFSFLPIIMIVLSFFAKVPSSVRMRFYLLLGLIVLIFVTVTALKGIGLLAALHPVIALALLLNSVSILKQLDRSHKAEETVSV